MVLFELCRRRSKKGRRARPQKPPSQILQLKSKAPNHNTSSVIKIFFFFFLWWATISCLQAQALLTPEWSYRVISTTEGLPGAKVHCIHQDEAGYLWMGTDKGLVRYDSYQFSYYTTQQGLTNNTVFQIKSDHAGNVWFSTFSGGFCYYTPKNNHIQAHPLNDTILQLLQNDWVGAWHIDQQNHIWWTPRNRPFKEVKEHIVYELSMDTLLVHKLDYVYFTNDSLRIPTRFFEESAAAVWSNNAQPQRSATFINAILSDRKTGRTVAGGEFGLYVWDNRQYLHRHPINEVGGVFKDSKEQYWVFNTNGLYHFAHWEALVNNQSEHLFAGVLITGFLEDNEGNYWVTTAEKGLFFLSANQLQQYPFKGQVSAMDTLNSELWLAMKNGHIFQINIADKTCKPVNNAPLAYLRDAKAVASSQQIFLSNHFVFYPQSQIFKPIALDWHQHTVKSFAKSHDGSLWVGHINGVSRINPLNQQLLFNSTAQMGFSPWVNTLCEDYAGNLWVGSTKGLYQINPQQPTLTYWGDQQKAFASSISAVCQDKQKRIWVASYSDGVWCRNTDNTWKKHVFPQSIYPLFVNTLYLDAQQVVWAGTNQGVYQLREPQDSLFRKVLSYQSGLVSNEVTCLWADASFLWIGTDQGLSLVSKQMFLETPAQQPRLYVTAISHGSADSSLLFPQNCTFEWHQNNFQIHWSYISFKQNTHLFRYRFKGQPWQITQQHQAQYSSLPAGSYEWELSVQMPDGNWFTLPQPLYITILPHWSQTWYFRAAVGGLLLLLLGGACCCVGELRANAPKCGHRCASWNTRLCAAK